MGFNTVAFYLNDMSHLIDESPRTAAWLLSHPPHSNIERWCNERYYKESTKEFQAFEHYRRSLAKEYNEPVLHSQALEVLPTFHADQTVFLKAGGNCIEYLPFVKYTTVKGKKCVVLELPPHMQDK